MSRSYEELTQQRKMLGNLGALEFLINIERQKLACAKELSTKLHDIESMHASTTQNEDQTNPLHKALKESLMLNQQLNVEIKRLTAEKTKLHKKCNELEESVNERFRELAVLSQLLIDKGNLQ